MFRKFINNFFLIVKFFLNLPRRKLRILFFDYKKEISQFSEENIFIQKKILKEFISNKNFLLLENFIKNKKNENLDKLFQNLIKSSLKKTIFIYIYSYLVSIKEYRLAVIYHKLLCKITNDNSFFYFQICTLNQSNILKFRLYSQTLGFKLIYLFLLYNDEKNYIKTILRLGKTPNLMDYRFNQADLEYKKNLVNKKINIIGSFDKKIRLKKKDLKNSIIIRLKNTNFLTDKDLKPNITYFNGTASLRYLKKKNYLSINKNLNWIVYINKSFYKNYKKNDNLKKRFANNNNSILFSCFTELNLLQKVLLDLILFNPKIIKLFNFNLYLSRYVQRGYNSAKSMTFNHNQIVMFDFINFFYKKKITHLDENLKNIIISGKDNYLKKLEKTWKR